MTAKGSLVLAPNKAKRTLESMSLLESTPATQLHEHRRTVDFDTYDVTTQQLIAMVKEKAIDVAPAYQRRFRWEPKRQSQLIESLFLGIPVPSLFMAANEDSTWELVDGVQRLSTIVRFAGNEEARERMGVKGRLELDGLEKLTKFNGLSYEDLQQPLKLHFELRPVKVVTLSDKSDRGIRFDLFHRLNTGGIRLSDQEIRDCVYRGKFSGFLEEMAKNRDFRKVVQLTAKQDSDGTREECVLRFFAFYDRYLEFDHSVRDFLNDYMEDAAHHFDYGVGRQLFRTTFKQLAAAFPDAIRRPSPSPKRTTPLNLFEGIAVGAAMAIDAAGTIRTEQLGWLGSPALLAYTSQSTNDQKNVRGRITYCRDRFLGVDT